MHLFGFIPDSNMLAMAPYRFSNKEAADGSCVTE